MMVTPNVRLVAPLGHGGMASVWVADHLALHTKVVVKFIAEDLARNLDALARFTREAAAAAQVKSPHVVQTFDHGVMEGGTPYIVMELLEGEDLAMRLLVATKMSQAAVVNVISQLARALDRAHARGIVHRDIKPNNIFLCDVGHGEIFVKLLDFGIAKGMELLNVDSGTKTGSMIGTPFYMSPEQLIGSKEIDFRSDLWSVGVVAFEAMTGSRPFDAETVGGLALKIHTAALPNPSTFNAGLPPAVDAWFARACARVPGERFGGAKEMADALAVAITGEVPRPLPSSPILDPLPGHTVPAPRASDAAALARTEKLGQSDLFVATDAGIERAGSSADSRSNSRGTARGPLGGRLALGAGIVVVLGIAAVVVPTLLQPKDKGSAASVDVIPPATAVPSAATTVPIVAASAVSTSSTPPVASVLASAAVIVPPAQAHGPTPPFGGQRNAVPRASGHATATAHAPSASPSTAPSTAPSAKKNDIY